MRHNQPVDRGHYTTIFMHIPKTAGTTLIQILGTQYPAARSVHITGNPDETIQGLSEKQRQELEILLGHQPFGMHHYLPKPAVYFTFLRDPVKLINSFYHYIQRVPHYLTHLVKDNNLSLVEFIERRETFMVENPQTRLFAGMPFEVPQAYCDEAMYEQALENLEQHFAVVGLVERFDQSLLLLQRALGWRFVYYTRQNVGNKRPPLPAETRHFIEEVNQFDRRLYAYAEAKLARQIQAQADDFGRAVRRFQQMNRWLGPLHDLYWEGRKFSVRQKIKEMWGQPAAVG